ncbi:MAG TPA: MFS transporter, partial [bacterium]|nr:MFS transporter [bacterium]
MLMKGGWWSGVSRNVRVLGVVSLFNDIASEMIYPVVPIFLTAVLGAPVAVVGLIEGFVEATASLLKLASGWFSDRFRRRKPFVVGGYAFSTFSKLLLGVAYVWPMVLAARFIDRLGKGIRTSARDALIVESTANGSRGLAFGFHRAMDSTGAVIGPLLAILLLKIFRDNLRTVFLISVLPAAVGVLLLIFLLRESGVRLEGRPGRFRLSWRELSPEFKVFLLVSVLFGLGNSSDVFLILRAKDLGLTTVLAIFAYVLYNLGYVLFSIPAGAVADRIGPRKVLTAGFLVYALVYLGFGLTGDARAVWILFPVYGVYIAFTDGVGKAYISNLVAGEKIGTAFGIYQMATGLCTFLASFIAGLLWTR